MLALVLGNVTMMASEHRGQPDWLTRACQVGELSFAALFTAEAALKLFALRWAYFGVRAPGGGAFVPDAWNMFDFAIVVGTNAGLVVRFATGDDSSVGALARSAARRVARFLRLARGYGGMRRLFDTLLVAAYFVNVGGLLLLLFFIHAAVGMAFAKVGYHGAVTPHAHPPHRHGTAHAAALRDGRELQRLRARHGARADDCVTDPEYDEHMCGFSDSRLRAADGCGSDASCRSS